MTLSRMLSVCAVATTHVLVCGGVRAEDCPGLLARQEIEGIDGPVAELTRALEQAGRSVDFWAPGPTATELEAWHESDCEQCPAPQGYDDVDFAVDTFQELMEASRALKDQPADQVAATWVSWAPVFLEQGGDGALDDALKAILEGERDTPGMIAVKGLRAWKTELEGLRAQLPLCQYEPTGAAGRVILNPPCQDGGFASVDGDGADEFAEAQRQLDLLIPEVERFRAALRAFDANMRAAIAASGAPFGGINPVTYAWRDSRGDHSVRVEVGPFKVPQVKKKKKGNFLVGKICLRVVDYEDDGSRAWVRVTRQDPARSLGFWRWNPFGGRITKMARVSYSFDRVGLAGK